MAIAQTTRRRACRALLAASAALLFGACGDEDPKRNGAGAIEQAGTTSLLKLRVGDCVSNLRESDADPDRGHNGVLKVRAVPCSQRHDAEVLRIEPLGGGEWPGYAIVNGDAARGSSALQPRLKKEAGRISLYAFKPTEERWNFEDQKEVLYLVLYDQPRRGTFD